MPPLLKILRGAYYFRFACLFVHLVVRYSVCHTLPGVQVVLQNVLTRALAFGILVRAKE